VNHNMTPQQLKNSILQLAIQGKLVEQRPEEGTGAELYKEIQAEKKRLVKAGKLKKEKPLPEISEEEKPFDIPESWMWVRLDDIVAKTVKRGKSATYTSNSGTLVFAQKCNTKAGNIDLSLALCLDETKLPKYPAEEFMLDNDIVINSTGNGTLGRVGVYRNSDNPDRKPIVPDSHVTVIRACAAMCKSYVLYCLKYYQPNMEKLGAGSTNQTELNANIVKALLFPLPPLAEQRRIVAKIEELLSLINRYAKAWERLEAFNTRFPLDMRKSLLQLAIQGMLVEQRAEEGTGDELYREIQKEKKRLVAEGQIKKRKPLPEIAEDEIPFEIPKSWKWVRVGHLVETITSGSRDWAQYYSENGDKFIRMGNLSRDSFEMRLDKIQHVTPPDGAEGNRTSLQEDDLLFSITAEIGLLGLIPANFGKAYINQHTAMIRFLSFLRNRYVPYLLLSDYAHKFYNGNGHGIKNSFRLDKIAQLPVPLPPLAEQKRIVAKLDEMLPLCEGLKG